MLQIFSFLLLISLEKKLFLPLNNLFKGFQILIIIKVNINNVIVIICIELILFLFVSSLICVFCFLLIFIFLLLYFFLYFLKLNFYKRFLFESFKQMLFIFVDLLVLWRIFSYFRCEFFRSKENLFFGYYHSFWNNNFPFF